MTKNKIFRVELDETSIAAILRQYFKIGDMMAYTTYSYSSFSPIVASSEENTYAFEVGYINA